MERIEKIDLEEAGWVALALFLSGGALLLHYALSWDAVVDGAALHVAGRVLSGERYGSDVYGPEPGYTVFLNALWIRLFGENILALRYPLVGLGVLQALFVTLFLLRKGPLLSVAGAFAVTSLGFVLYPVPSPFWYALFCAFSLAFLLERKAHPFWVGLVSGVCLGIELHAGFCLFAGMLACLAFRENRFRSIPFAGLGVLCGLLPLLLYQGINGTLEIWASHVLSSAPPSMPPASATAPSYVHTFLYAAAGIFFSPSLLSFANFLFWIVLFTLPVATLFYVLKALKDRRPVPAIAIIALFYTPVAFLFQVPAFLFFVLPLYIPAVLFMASENTDSRINPFAAGLFLFVAYIALLLHAADWNGRPLPSSVMGLTTGVTKIALDAPTAGGVKLYQPEAGLYESVLGVIDDTTKPNDTIFVFPNSPELYALSGRRNPFPFTGLYESLSSQAVEAVLQANPPALVVYRKRDPRRTMQTMEILRYLTQEGGYERVQILQGQTHPFKEAPEDLTTFEIYQKREG